MEVNVLLRNDIDRKRLFEAVKDTYVPAWRDTWKRDSYFETGYCTYPSKAVMNTVNKTYLGTNDSAYTMTVEDFIKTYIHKEDIGEL